jgi:hypothetical protein
MLKLLFSQFCGEISPHVIIYEDFLIKLNLKIQVEPFKTVRGMCMGRKGLLLPLLFLLPSTVSIKNNVKNPGLFP